MKLKKKKKKKLRVTNKTLDFKNIKTNKILGIRSILFKFFFLINLTNKCDFDRIDRQSTPDFCEKYRVFIKSLIIKKKMLKFLKISLRNTVGYYKSKPSTYNSSTR